MKCPWADGECQDQKYIDACKARVAEEVVWQLKMYKQDEKEAAEIVVNNQRILAPYCWRLK